jgi:flagellar M-ring protein FliF
MESFKEYYKRITERIRALSPSQMVLLIAVGAGFLVGLIVVAVWVSDVKYSVLYSDLDHAEAGDIVNYLVEENIDYKLESGGSTILVPSGDVYKLRISLASQGLPSSGHVGYSLFDQSNLGMTEFLQNLNFRRALEGELMNTIMQLSNVQAARVHIVMPKDRLFKEDKKEATASVVLKLKGPGGLSKSQMAGITHLVASSVEGLKTENISIIDYNGNLLSSKQEQDVLAGLTASQLEVRKNVENYLEDKAQSMLDGVIGRDKSIVRVSAEVNFKQVERTSELFDPNSSVIRSEEKIQEASSVSDKQDEFAESNDEKNTESTITNYEINKTVEHIINSVGNIDRLTVAVMLDGIYNEVENDEGVVETVYSPRSQEEIDRITAIVKSAVGYDSQRNDVIEVVNLSFDRTTVDVEQDKLDQMIQRQFYYDLGKKIILILLLVAVGFYMRKKLKSLFGRVFPPIKSVRQESAMDVEGSTEDIEVEEPPVPVIKRARKPKLIDHMQKEAANRPEEIARVIKTMISTGDK